MTWSKAREGGVYAPDGRMAEGYPLPSSEQAQVSATGWPSPPLRSAGADG